MRIDGYLSFRESGTGGAFRRGHKTLTRRPCRYWLLGERWSLLVDWVPHEGVWPWKLYLGAPDGKLLVDRPRPAKGLGVKKKIALGLVGAPLPALPLETAVLKKCPRLMEHLIVTGYDDGTVRTPGSFRFDNRIIYLTLTLYDPDSGMRLAINGPTVDDCFALCEKLLGAPDCPWEVDRYLTEQLSKKEKEKSRRTPRKK